MSGPQPSREPWPGRSIDPLGDVRKAIAGMRQHANLMDGPPPPHVAACRLSLVMSEWLLGQLALAACVHHGMDLQLTEAVTAREAAEARLHVLRTAAREHNAPEPPPTEGSGPPIWELVIADMHERDRLGREKYGTPLRARNGRKALVDAYQEVLDLAVYLRQAIEEGEE